MSNRPAIITFGELPPRAKGLSSQELSQVFGGCIGFDESGCWKPTDCCPGLTCGDTWCEKTVN
jgi:hypothetical protein